MSFLYRTADLGPTGDAGKVVVVDTDAMTVLSIGLTGAYGLPRVEEGMAKLEAWLDEHPDWVADGSPRAFYYNGPYVPSARKWSEIQVPVRPADGSPASDAFPKPVPPRSEVDESSIAAAGASVD